MIDAPLITRLAIFAGVLAVLAACEARWPRRGRLRPVLARWPHHLALAGVYSALVRLILPAGLVGVALVAERASLGLFNRIGAPSAVAFVASVAALDLLLYAQHWLFHHVPVLWRLHRVHHADVDVDATTGIRFHPIEILLSLGLKAGAIVALGAPAAAVLTFEVLLNAASMFNHANLRLPARAEPVIRALIVTPDMHRVHHSIERRETDSNFGFNFPWWDRLFGTYRAQPAAGHEQMTLGLAIFRDPGDTRIDRLLLEPFLSGRAAPAPESTPGSDGRRETATRPTRT